MACTGGGNGINNLTDNFDKYFIEKMLAQGRWFFSYDKNVAVRVVFKALRSTHG